MKKFLALGASTPEESQRERDHRALARRAAADGIVLLANDGALPLAPGPVALYGPGSRRTVKGGSGSGEVNERSSVSIEQGLLAAGFSFPTTLWMDRFEDKYTADLDAWRSGIEKSVGGSALWNTMKMFIKIGETPKPFPSCTPIREDELTDEASTAIYVLSRQAGEGHDRRVEQGDYLLSDLEVESLRLLSEHYEKLILIVNTGGPVDLSVLDKVRVDAVLYVGQPGMEGGSAVADVLTGAVNPSGRLAATWARDYGDYPAAESFGHRNGDLDHEDYSEGIYVGYRWFTTRGVASRFPFGHGLSYTSFETTANEPQLTGTAVSLTAAVANTGAKPGREVVQLYLAKPESAIDHEAHALAAFAKTGLLASGDSEEVSLAFDLAELATFDEARSAFVLEAGTYTLLLGKNAEDVAPCGTVALDRELMVEEVAPIGSNEPLTDFDVKVTSKVAGLLKTLTPAEKVKLVVGGGYAMDGYVNIMGAAGRTSTKLARRGVPNVIMCDGPAGLNVIACTGVGKRGGTTYPAGLPEQWRWGWLKKAEPVFGKLIGGGRPLYRYMSAWPSETVQAQTWDTALVEEVGRGVGREMLEIGVSVWLAPGMNIQRNPLCGRNFEYYSEDPLVAGRMAAAITRGVQGVGGVGVSVKHFCCNNVEDNRMEISSDVSQRALREIYLRAFRIAIEEGKPWTVMSCYNQVNGLHVCESPDLLTRVLRDEWGFEGLVMSDWSAVDHATSYAAAINAGNDLIMPGDVRTEKALLAALKDGSLDQRCLEVSAARVLTLIFRSATSKSF